MEHKTIDVGRDGSFCYTIHLEPDFGYLAKALLPLDKKNRRLCIVTDQTVEALYLEKFMQEVSGSFASVSVFSFPAGEEHKTLDTVRSLYEYLVTEKFDRKDMLAALGGGVVGDLAGFAAATYLRGIDFFQVPTTLLSQVDSSIGGKTGVDFDAYKNMVGAFHMPRLVYMDLGALGSLPERQFANGMAEIVKHGLIQDEGYYRWLIEHREEIGSREQGALFSMVEASCGIKRKVVEEDPTEKGIRTWLNFGHTVGHAVEKLKDFTLLHGECVSIGIVAAAFLSWRRGCLTEEKFHGIEEALKGFRLPVRVSGLSPERILEATKLDKKMEAGRIRFVLLKRIGEAFTARDVEEEELLEAIRYVCREDGDE